MRDRFYLYSFLFVSASLLYMGRNLLQKSELVALGLTFTGTTAAAVLGLALYRVQLELRASRQELRQKRAEIAFAREVQQALFPQQFPNDSGLEFAGACVPASGISGDYYDVLRLTDSRIALALADISGKGISAALLMSNLHAMVRILAEARHSASEVCSLLNRHLCRLTEASRFATMFYAEWDRSERRLTYVNAGHTSPILWGLDRFELLDLGGPPLGLFPEAVFQAGEVSLRPGDSILVYSDGITEAGARAGSEFGEERLKMVVTASREEPLPEMRKRILDAVESWSGPEPEDDVTFLLVRATAPGREVV